MLFYGAGKDLFLNLRVTTLSICFLFFLSAESSCSESVFSNVSCTVHSHKLKANGKLTYLQYSTSKGIRDPFSPL